MKNPAGSLMLNRNRGVCNLTGSIDFHFLFSSSLPANKKIMVLSDFTGVGVGFGFGVGCGFGVGWGFGGMPLNVLGVGVGGGCGVGLGLGWGFGTAFGSHYRSSRLTFQGIELENTDKREDKLGNMSNNT